MNDTVLVVGPVWQMLVDYVTRFIADPKSIVQWHDSQRISVNGQMYALYQVTSPDRLHGIRAVHDIVIVDPNYRLGADVLHALSRIVCLADTYISLTDFMNRRELRWGLDR